jgi:hypothetical protein
LSLLPSKESQLLLGSLAKRLRAAILYSGEEIEAGELGPQEADG